MLTNVSCSTMEKGAIGAFQAALQDLYKVAWISSTCDKSEATTNEIFEETKKAFLQMDQDSTEEECFTFVDNLRHIPDVTQDKIEKIGDSKIKDICNGVQRLQKLLEQKFSSDTIPWAEMKRKCIHSQEEYDRCGSEGKQIEADLEAEKAKTNKKVSKHVTEEQNSEKYPFLAKDFRSLIPSYLKANVEEEIEFIERFSEAKLFHLRKREKESEKKLIEASHKCNRELWEIVEETMKMKAFMEWVKSEYELKMKDYCKKRDELFSEFAKEMEECREMCQKYKEVDSAYVQILEERREKELQRTKIKAATVIQAHIRGFLVRRRNKKSSDQGDRFRSRPTIDQVTQNA